MHAFHAPVRAWALALGLALTALGASAAPSLSVSESVDLPAQPAEVWRTVGRFDSLAWHPVVADTLLQSGDAGHAGAVRTVVTKDGARIVESLERLDAAQHQMVYRIQASPLPVTGYESTLKVLPRGKGSRVVWSSTFQRDAKAEGVTDDKAREIVSGIYKAGFDGLKAKFPMP